jgi:hypothetical protein
MRIGKNIELACPSAMAEGEKGDAGKKAIEPIV